MRPCGGVSAPRQRCPWRCGSSRTLIVLWQCRSCWELGEVDRWSKVTTAGFFSPLSKDHTSRRVWKRFGSFSYSSFKGLLPEVGQWIGLEYEGKKRTGVKHVSANKNYTRGIQQYIYPIILSPSFKFQESESLKIGMRREVTGWFWFHLTQSDPYDLSLVYDTTTFVLHIFAWGRLMGWIILTWRLLETSI